MNTGKLLDASAISSGLRNRPLAFGVAALMAVGALAGAAKSGARIAPTKASTLLAQAAPTPPIPTPPMPTPAVPRPQRSGTLLAPVATPPGQAPAVTPGAGPFQPGAMPTPVITGAPVNVQPPVMTPGVGTLPPVKPPSIGMVTAAPGTPEGAGAGVSEGATTPTPEGAAEGTTPTARRLSPEGEPLATLVFPPGPIPINTILQKIRLDTGIAVEARGAVQGQQVQGPILMKGVTVEQAVRWIAGQRPDWVSYRIKDAWFISDQKTYEQTELSRQRVRRLIRLQNLSAEEADRFIVPMLSAVGTHQVDPRLNQIIVVDLLANVDAIVNFLRLLDQRVFLRVFTLKHAKVEDVLALLQEYKSAPGRLQPVPLMRQIIAEDTYENIQRMEVIVDLVDRGPEMRIYDLNNVDIDGTNIDELQEQIEEMITEGAYLRFDLDAAVMLLKDVPAVHERVRQILDAVDKPPRQVYIQAEIVETSLGHKFELGTEWGAADERLLLPGEGSGLASTSTAGVNLGGFKDIVRQMNDAYPQVNVTEGGITLDYLSRHARLAFVAVMTDKQVRILSQPRVLVKNGAVADITEGGSKAYATTTYYGSGGYSPGGNLGGYVPSVQPGSVPVGITLSVEPAIMNNGLIYMRIMLASMGATPSTVKLGGQDYSLQDTTNQSVNTELVIPDGQTRMIGGMIRNSETNTRNGVPFLKDIPVAGVLFGKKSVGPISRTTLLMFITPTIVQEQARKYAVPPDDDEKTPPEFIERGTWGQVAIDRAVDEAMSDLRRKGMRVGEGLEAEAYRPPLEEIEPTGRPIPSVRLEHGPTEPTTRTRETFVPALGPIQPPTQPAAEIAPVPEPVATTITVQPVATTPPVVGVPEPTEGMPEEIVPEETPPEVQPQPAPDEPATTETEFPTTGAVLLRKGPPRELVSARRPGDVPLPTPKRLAQAEAKRAKPVEEDEEEVTASDFNVVVVGEGGRAYAARPTGEILESPRLGTMEIPAATLAAVATPAPGAPPGPKGPTGTPRIIGRTPGRPTPPGRTPPRSTPYRPPSGRIGSRYDTPYGAPPGQMPVFPQRPGRYR